MRSNRWLPVLLIAIAGCLGSTSYAAEPTSDEQADPLFQQASKSMGDGKYDEAIASLSQLLQFNPNHGSALWSRGQLYLTQKKYALAEADFNQVVRLAPAFADGHGLLAWVLILQGKAKDALTPATKAYELNSENMSWANNLGHVYLLTGDEIKARDYYLQAIKLVKEKAQYDAILDDLKLFIQNGWEVNASQRAMVWVGNLYANRDELKHADELLSQVIHLKEEGKFAQAILLADTYSKAIKNILGDDNPSYATSLNNMAYLYDSMADYSKALPLYQQAMEIRKKVLGENHPDYATSLNNLAGLYESMGDYDKALPLYQQALEIRKIIMGESHPDYATSLNNLAHLHQSMGDYAKALPLYQQASAIDRKVLGENHPDYAIDLNNLAELYRATGDYAEALPLQKQALSIREKSLGSGHADTATSLNNLALLYYKLGEYNQALPLYRQALTIVSQVQGENHPSYAISLNNLAVLYKAMGDYAKALPLYQRASVIDRIALGENHPDYARDMNNLAQLYREMGDYEKALPLYLQAMQVRKKSLGEEHPEYASDLNNLAGLYEAMGAYAKALPLYQDAFEIRKKVLGKDHPEYAQSLNNLAGLYDSMGDYAKALPLYQQALEIRKKSLGENHHDYAGSLNNLAALYVSMGDYAKAVPLYQRATAIRKAALGEAHPDYATGLYNTAIALSVQRKPDEALLLMRQASGIIDQHIATTFPILSEQQKLHFINMHEGEVHGMLSLIHRQLSGDQAAIRSGLDLVLSRKGIVFDAQARQSEAIARSLDPETKKRWDELSSQRVELARLLQNKPAQMSGEDYQKRITEFQDNIARLEGVLASKSALVAQEYRQRKITSKAVAATLGKDAALVEYAKIRDYDWDHGKWSDSWRYLAFVLHGDGKVKMVDLGDADKLEQDVQAALKPIGIVGGDIARQAEAAHVLYDRLWQPIAAAVGDVPRVVFSPDGLLNLVPFAAMQDKDDRYLIESKQIAYVTSGRDLTRGDLGIKPESELYLAANPQFDLAAQAGPLPVADGPTSGAVRSAGFGMHFSPLPGTAIEAEQIPPYLTGKQTVLTGAQATEESVLNARRPHVMHLSTHGFFLADQAAVIQGTRGAERINGNAPDSPEAHALPKGYENPLVRSGLAFAGANHAKDAQDGRDGLLTALEVSGMDLHGTDLVTLSACETGRGEVKSGEGVFGLRRAFALAGASHLMMSLWPVSDEVTARQMQTFYQLYGKRTNPAAALRQAQLASIAELRGRKGQAEPALWAPFIVQGW